MQTLQVLKERNNKLELETRVAIWAVFTTVALAVVGLFAMVFEETFALVETPVFIYFLVMTSGLFMLVGIVIGSEENYRAQLIGATIFVVCLLLAVALATVEYLGGTYIQVFNGMTALGIQILGMIFVTGIAGNTLKAINIAMKVVRWFLDQPLFWGFAIAWNIGYYLHPGMGAYFMIIYFAFWLKFWVIKYDGYVAYFSEA